MGFMIESSCSDCALRKEADEHLAKCDTIEELIEAWAVRARARLLLGTGIDDDEKHTLLFIGLSRDPEIVAEAYLPLTIVRALYPSLRPIDEFISTQVKDGWATLKTDDKALNRYAGCNREKRYHDALGGPLVTLAEAMPFILSVVIADGGEVTIAPHVDSFDDEDEEDHSSTRVALPENLLSVTLEYHSAPIGGCQPIWIDRFYVDPNG